MEILRSHQSGTIEAGRIAVGAPGWTTPMTGIRVRGDVPLTHSLILRAAVHASAGPSVACDLTAAHLWSMVVPSGFGLAPDAQACAVATVRDGSRIRAGGVRGRRLTIPPEHITELDGIPVTTPARTWIDCAQYIRWTDLVAMGDAILRSGLATSRELEAMVKWGVGRRGILLARLALPILDEAAESPGESWVRALTARAGLARPACNLSVIVGPWTFRLDLAWADVKVAVEYDGEEHHGPDQEDHDRWRRSLLREAGWAVLVITKDDFADSEELVRRIQALVTARTRNHRSHAQ